MKNVLTITTDFGDQLPGAQLMAVIASYDFKGRVIENHTVQPFSIVEGAFAIQLLSKFSPKNSVHVGVIDPGVGSKREGVVIKTNKSWFVGPNNGLLYPAARKEIINRVWELNDSWFGKVTNTFHGRDVFVKAAALLSRDKKPKEFGCKSIAKNNLKSLKFKKGQVVHIDSYGNLKVWWKSSIKPKEILEIKTDQDVFQVPIVKTFDDVSLGKPLAYAGSSDILELAVNQGRGDEFFKINQGAVIRINKIS